MCDQQIITQICTKSINQPVSELIKNYSAKINIKCDKHQTSCFDIITETPEIQLQNDKLQDVASIIVISSPQQLQQYQI